MYPQVTLNTICNSYFDVTFAENNFDLVLSTYSFHHFTIQQKARLYSKIYNCLKANGYFINGDTVCKDKNTEINLMHKAEAFYQRQKLIFGSMHIDIPLALGTELDLLSDAGFNNLSVEKIWNTTALIKTIK